MSSRVNFFLIGPPKCGTTSLANYLGQHPEIQMSNPKEPNYFVYTQGNPYGWPLDQNISSVTAYHKLFNFHSNYKVFADASTCYVYCDHCAGSLKSYNPNAKFAVILRDPVIRAYSMYRYWHQSSGNWDRMNIPEFISAFENDALITPGMLKAGMGKPVYWLKDMGYYGRMLQKYYAEFDCNQISIIDYDELDRNPKGVTRALFEFLKVEPNFVPRIRRLNATVRPKIPGLDDWVNGYKSGPSREAFKKLATSIGVGGPAKGLVNRMNRRVVEDDLPSATHARLIEVYRDDIALIAQLSGRDFSRWLNPRTKAA